MIRANAIFPVFYSWNLSLSECCFQADWSRDLLYIYPQIPLLHMAFEDKVARKGSDRSFCFSMVAKDRVVPLVVRLFVDLPV